MGSEYASISFPTDMVTLKFAGFENTEYRLVVHKDILCQSPWFARRCEDTTFDGSISYPEITSKELGENLVNWLYFNTLPYSQADLAKTHDEGIRIGTEIVDAYCCAIGVGLEEYANALLDAFCTLAQEDMPWIRYLDRLQHIQPVDEGLRALVMKLLTWSILQVGWDHYIQEVNRELPQMVRKKGQFAESLIKCLADPEARTKLPVQQKKGRCKWHIHHLTKKC